MGLMTPVIPSLSSKSVHEGCKPEKRVIESACIPTNNLRSKGKTMLPAMRLKGGNPVAPSGTNALYDCCSTELIIPRTGTVHRFFNPKLSPLKCKLQ